MLSLPYSMQIGGGLKPGFVVKVLGKIRSDTSGFTVKLASGPKPGDDAPFAVVPKNSNEVPMTCHKHGRWIKEEVIKDTHFPFKIQTEFSLTIQCLKNKYKISVNSYYLAEYCDGLPCQLAQYVTVDGAVELREVKVQTAEGNSTRGDTETAVPVDRNLTWSRDVSVTVEGIPVRAEPHRMVIDFGTDTSPQDILLHFNASFKDQALGRNSRFGDYWDRQGESELYSSFPFAYGVPFKLEFTVDDEYMYVDLNDIFLLKYRHRKTPFTEMKKMNIYGSVIITKASMGPIGLLQELERRTFDGRVIAEKD